jgi:choline dehydrogenase
MRRVGADTVIVGAGSAGAVIAARMTESSAHDVLLLEAGPDYASEAALPEDLRDGRRNSMISHDWGLRYRPSPESPILHDYPRGRVVGGSSAVNTCIALRGQPYDYDEWEGMGLEGWSFASCLPSFKRIEDDRDFGETEHHGAGGPIPIRRHPDGELVRWQAAFVEACVSLGYPRCADTNDPRTTGVGPHAMNKVDGVRMSAARYLSPAVRARGNMRVRPGTLVRRVLFRDRRVTGLEVETEGCVHEIDARRVVLCAGAIATPCILLRSGVGPRDRVAAIGVDLVRDVASVGARLLEHPGAAVFFRPRPGVLDVSRGLIQTVLRYGEPGVSRENEMLVQPGSFVPFPRVTFPLMSLMCQIGKPYGVGRLELRSANPRHAPRLYTELFRDERDLSRAVAAMQLAARIAATAPMKDLATHFFPSASVIADRDRLGRFIRRICGSGYHPCGTVPMGEATDARGRVRGVEGLLVADASIMPTVPSANTNLPVLMMGERFGEWLRDGAI